MAKRKDINEIPAPDPYNEEEAIEKERQGCVATLKRIDVATDKIAKSLKSKAEKFEQRRGQISHVESQVDSIKECVTNNATLAYKLHDRIGSIHSTLKNICDQFNANLLKIFDGFQTINANLIKFRTDLTTLSKTVEELKNNASVNDASAMTKEDLLEIIRVQNKSIQRLIAVAMDSKEPKDDSKDMNEKGEQRGIFTFHES